MHTYTNSTHTHTHTHRTHGTFCCILPDTSRMKMTFLGPLDADKYHLFRVYARNNLRV